MRFIILVIITQANKFYHKKQMASQLKSTATKMILRQYQQLYLCPISLEIMQEPYSLPCGHTFEKRYIEQVIRNVGHCPMDRKQFTMQNLGPNFFAKQSIQLFQKQLAQKKEKQLAQKKEKQLAQKKEKQLAQKKEKQLAQKKEKQLAQKKEKQLAQQLNIQMGKLQIKGDLKKIVKNEPQKVWSTCTKSFSIKHDKNECQKCSSILIDFCLSCNCKTQIDKEMRICSQCKQNQLLLQVKYFKKQQVKDQCPKCQSQLDSYYHTEICMEKSVKNRETCKICNKNFYITTKLKEGFCMVCAPLLYQKKVNQQARQIHFQN